MTARGRVPLGIRANRAWYPQTLVPGPWNDNGLEWTVPSPAPHGNFAEVPIVYRGPYEFSSPLVEEDFLPQTRKLDSDTEPAAASAAE